MIKNKILHIKFTFKTYLKTSLKNLRFLNGEQFLKIVFETIFENTFRIEHNSWGCNLGELTQSNSNLTQHLGEIGESFSILELSID